MDVQAFFRKWLRDLADAQQPSGSIPAIAPYPNWGPLDGGAAWAEAGIICPWTLYLCYGDKRILARQYDSMARYMAYLKTVDFRTRHCFGDWLNVNDWTPVELIG